MLRVFLAAAFICVFALGGGETKAASCAPAGSDPVQSIRQMYAGAMAGDRAATLAVFDRDAYLFDGGARLTPEAITDLILKAEAVGTKPVWTLEGVETHTGCDTAWATWTNRGRFTSAAGSSPRVWLESAVFVWRDGAWKIRFFHSTPVAITK